MEIKRLKSTDNNFLSELKMLLTFDVNDNEEIIKTTNDIINCIIGIHRVRICKYI